jgi:hypothetical protein
MIDIPTVLVLGAGASWPYWFPTGVGLKNGIAAVPHGDSNALLESLDSYKRVRLAEALRWSGQLSIDALLESRSEFAEIGKMSIGGTLLPIEEQCVSRPPREGDWYPVLFRALGVGREPLSESKLSIITFNYDRSLELWLATMLSNSTGKELGECWAEVCGMKIMHVYGALSAPVNCLGGSRYPKVHLSAANLLSSSSKIRVIAERATAADDEGLSQARAIVHSARRLYFLGFGYDKTNLARIGIDVLDSEWQLCRASMEIQGSAYQMVERERETARDLVGPGLRLGGSADDCLLFLRRNIAL